MTDLREKLEYVLSEKLKYGLAPSPKITQRAKGDYIEEISDAILNLFLQAVPKKKQPSDPIWHNKPHKPPIINEDPKDYDDPDDIPIHLYPNSTTIVKNSNDGWNEAVDEMVRNIKDSHETH
jgi:hypothetical protein